MILMIVTIIRMAVFRIKKYIKIFRNKVEILILNGNQITYKIFKKLNKISLILLIVFIVMFSLINK